jgi:1-acyl-sn-glycerol-3-phosphate acyltransferase
LISIDFEVSEIEETKSSVTVYGEARLWVDGLKIYHAPRIGMRMIENSNPTPDSQKLVFCEEIGTEIEVSEIGGDLVCNNLPLNKLQYASKDLKSVEIVGIDETLVQDSWLKLTGIKPDLFGDLRNGLINQFVRAIVFEDYNSFKKLEKKPVLYLANHQTGIESILFLSLAIAFNKIGAKAIAKVEHKETWMGQVVRMCEEKYQSNFPLSLLPYDRERPEDLLAMFASLAQKNSEDGFSLLVHVDGTRQKQADEVVKNISAAVLDFAILSKIPIVPVRFFGGLPEKGDHRIEFPYKMGKQDYYIGKPIDAIELSKLPLKERKSTVIDAINNLGSGTMKRPALFDDEFESRVDKNQRKFKIKNHQSVFISILETLDMPSEETKKLLSKDMKDESLKELFKLIFN